jgi:heme O synthase-like polyprenyltransferase
MDSARVEKGNPSYKIVRDYVEVLKPCETSLITFIGVCAAIIAGLSLNCT